jgi:hypothetical protein
MVAIYFLITVIKVVAFTALDDYVPVEMFVADIITLVMIILFMVISQTDVRLTIVYPWIIVGIICIISILALFNLIFDGAYHLDFITLVVVYNILLVNLITGALAVHTMFVSIIILLAWIIVGGVFESDKPFTYVGDLILLIVMIVLNGYMFYSRELHLRTIRNLEFLANKEIKQTENLVKNLLPPHVYELVKNDTLVTEKLEDTTLLYADIVGFTAFSSNKQPVEVVAMLSDLFKRFDKMCASLGLYKVCTIGDCYVIMSYRIDPDGTRDAG